MSVKVPIVERIMSANDRVSVFAVFIGSLGNQVT